MNDESWARFTAMPLRLQRLTIDALCRRSTAARLRYFAAGVAFGLVLAGGLVWL